jgi:hypothetical protein
MSIEIETYDEVAPQGHFLSSNKKPRVKKERRYNACYL